MTISQDFKCALGLHKFQLHETREITDARSDVVKVVYVSRCVNCGRFHTKTIHYEQSYR